MFVALELHPCSATSVLMPRDRSALKKGLRRSLSQSRYQRWGEKKNWKSKGKISGHQEGRAPGLKPPGSHAGKVPAEAPVTSGPSSYLRKAANPHCRRGLQPLTSSGHWGALPALLFQKPASSPPPSANSTPAGTHPPAASAPGASPPRHCDPLGGKIPSRQRNYRSS